MHKIRVNKIVLVEMSVATSKYLFQLENLIKLSVHTIRKIKLQITVKRARSWTGA